MTKARRYFAVAMASLVAFVIEVISGFVLWLALPRGFGGGRGAQEVSFIFERHTWLSIHDWAAVALVGFIGLHIAMHWPWIVRMSKSLFKNR